MASKLLYPSEHSYKLSMKPLQDGTRLSDCTLSIELQVYSNRKVDIDSSYIKKIDEDNILIVVTMDKAERLGKGEAKIIVHIGIPDSDFPDGYRNQIYEVCLD
jgi:hypothetical protein